MVLAGIWGKVLQILKLICINPISNIEFHVPFHLEVGVGRHLASPTRAASPLTAQRFFRLRILRCSQLSHQHTAEKVGSLPRLHGGPVAGAYTAPGQVRAQKAVGSLAPKAGGAAATVVVAAAGIPGEAVTIITRRSVTAGISSSSLRWMTRDTLGSCSGSRHISMRMSFRDYHLLVLVRTIIVGCLN